MTDAIGSTLDTVAAVSTDIDIAETAGAAPAAALLAQAVIEAPLPQPGETVVLTIAPGHTVALQFAYDAAEGQMVDGDLVLAINGGEVVLQGFAEAAAAQPPVELTNADGVVIELADFLVALDVSPEDLAVPAAGGDTLAGSLPEAVTPNQGAGFAQGEGPRILASLSARGPVDPTALGYDAPERQFTLFDLEEEIDGADGTLGATVETTVDGGEGGSGYDFGGPDQVTGSFAGGFEDWQPNQHLGIGAEAPMQLIVSLAPSDNEEILSITIENIPLGVTIFAPGQVVIGDGTNSVTIFAADLGGIFVRPPAETDGDISLSLSAEIVDPDSGVSSVLQGSVTAIVDAAADRPEDVQADAPDQVGIGADVTFDVQAQFGDWADGSEAHFLLVEVPEGWSDPSGHPTESFAPGNGWGIPQGSYIRVPATVDPATGVGTAAVTLTAPSALPAESASETFYFGVVAKAVDTAADAELTDANNLSYAPMGGDSQMWEIPVTVVKPHLSIDDVEVHEDAGTATFTVTLHGAIGVAVTLGYATADASAADGHGEAGAGIPDYTAANGSVTFPASTDTVQTITITVPITDDTVFENPESFFVDLVGADPAIVDLAGSDLQGVGTIIDNDPVPAITISDGSPFTAIEPDAASDLPTKMQFTVTLSNPSSEAVTVYYQTVSGTATEGVDFENESGVITFAPGETSKIIEIDILGDNIDELLESFTVELSSPVNAIIADHIGAGQIEDNDPTPVLEINDSSANEGGRLTFTLSLSNPSSGDIVLDLAAGTPGSATSGADYETSHFQYFNGSSWVAAGGPDGTLVTIPAGQTSLKVRIDTFEDWTDEPNETMTLSAVPTAGSAAVDVSDTGTGTIVDDDPTPTLVILDSFATEGNPLTFVLGLSNPSSGDVVLDLAAGMPGSATPGVDYETVSFQYFNGSSWVAAGGAGGTQVTIPAGKLGLLVRVDSHEDLIHEGLESFTLSATPVAGSAPVNAADTGTGFILDDDPKPAISIADGTPSPQAEPDASGDAATTILFTVTLSNPSSQAVTVAYNAVSGTAVAGVDFDNASGTLTFAPGETSKVIAIDVYGDDIDEALENFTIQLSSPTNAWILDGNGVGHIADNDPTPVLSIGDGSAEEGDALTFTLSLSNPSSGDIVLDLAAGMPGTGAPGADYEITGLQYFNGASWVPAGGPNGTLVTIAAGQTSLLVRVDSIEDLVDEPNETFTLSATAAPGSAAVDTSDAGIGTINDDDAAPTLAINDVQVTEGDPVGGNDNPDTYVTFTVTKTGLTSETVTVKYNVVEGSAVEPEDYFIDGGTDPLSGTLTFAPGETTKTITLKITDDQSVEGTETFSVMLSDPTNATIADGTGIGTIIDDDVNLPDAVDDTASVVEGNSINYQLMLVVDRSGSMDDNPDGPGGYASRLQLAVSSLKNLIDSYTASTSGTVQVKIVQFADSAGYLAGSDHSFVDAATAKSLLDTLTTGGNTDYDHALAVAAGGIGNAGWVQSSATTQGLVSFVSDGKPTDGDLEWSGFFPSWNPNEVDSQEEWAWQQTLNDKGVQAIAVGVGAGIAGSSSGLDALGTVAFTPSTGGYADSDSPVIVVATDSELSAALIGTTPSVVTGNVIANDSSGLDGFPAAPANKLVDVDLSGGGTLVSKVTAGDLVTIVTSNGMLQINLETGAYQYNAKPNSGGQVDTFVYTIQDALGGDTDSAVLTIGIGERITLPEGVANASGSEAADVITGNSLANILNGLGGDDIIYGLGGNDTLNGGAGDDRLSGGAGNDSMTGGAGIDTFAFALGDQGEPAPVVSKTYTFEDVTKSNDKAFAYEFEVSSSNFSNLNALDPASNSGYVASSLNEASNGNYANLYGRDNDHYQPNDPSGSNSQVLWFQFNLTEDPADITELEISLEGRQDNSASNGENAILGIWNHATGDWENLSEFRDDSGNDSVWSATLTSNPSSYVDGSGRLTLAFFNEDKGGWLRVDDVRVEVKSQGSPSVIDAITDFESGSGGDVLDLDDLLPAGISNASGANVLDNYLHFEQDGANTNILVDHNGGGSFQPSMQIVLQGVDLTSNGAFSDAQIIQSLIDSGNLVA